MKIGIIITRVGGVDGVALETEKWIDVLKRMGHEVFVVSGIYESGVIDRKHKDLIPNLYMYIQGITWSRWKSFYEPADKPDKIIKFLKKKSKQIENKLMKWTKKRNLDMIIAENTNSLPMHVPLAMAIKQIAKNTKIKTISHNHDFYWERGDRFESPFEKINKIVRDNFPLNLKNVENVVINTYNQKYLKREYGIKAIKIPNVMDFNSSFAQKNEFNKTLPKDLGLKKKDIPLLQVTRIITRKYIENAIELVSRLNDKHVKLIITGRAMDDESGKYFNKLKNLIDELDLKDQIIFAGKLIERRSSSFLRYPYYIRLIKKLKGERTKKYSISDAYAYARACTYFSSYEGFGNAFVEALVAKKPIFVNNYKPVFWPDIGSKGFKTVMIEDNKLTEDKVEEMASVIYDRKKCREIGEYNFELGKKYFSYEVLEEKLKEILDSKF